MTALKYDIRELQGLRRRLEGNAKLVDKALGWATTAAANKAATLISRDLRDTYVLKASDIKSHLRIRRIERDATRALLYTGGRLPLEQFSPKQRWVAVSRKRQVKSGPRKGAGARRRGVSIHVRRDRGRQLVAGGWFAKEHVLRRARKEDNRSDARRQYGPSIPGMVAHPHTIEAAQQMVRETLPSEFSGRLEYLLDQKTGRT